MQAFFKRLDLIDWGLPGKLIINWDFKFISKFWAKLFARLEVKLLYSTVYQPMTDCSSERTNQIIEIALCFFVHALEDASF